MRVLGIDPGTALMGYAVLAAASPRPAALAYGHLATPAGMPVADRLLHLYNGVRDLIARWRPDLLAVEELFFGRNVTTAIHVGQARGVVLLAAAQAGVPVAEFTPAQVKQAVAGWGRADKGQVQRMVQLQLGLAEPPRPDDVADAVAVALTGLVAQPLAARLARGGAGGEQP